MTEQNKMVKVSYRMLDETFPDYPEIDKNMLQMTTTGIYSVSKKAGAKLICELIYKNNGKNKNITVTDGTGNVGSDTLMLAKYFDKVNSIELDTINYNVLKNNIDVYNFKNINLINGDTTKELENLEQDVIYIDAPWGGVGYKNAEHMKLYLGEMELSDLFNKFKKSTKMFLFKVPKNYDINYFLEKTKVNKLKIYSHINEFKHTISYLILLIKIV